MQPLAAYQSFLEEEQTLREQFERRLSRLANVRLAVFIVAAGAVGYWLFTKSPLSGGVALAAFLLFTWVARGHQRIENLHARHVSGCVILERSIERLQGHWDGISDDGRQFRDAAHPFSGDLDLFGPHSLYQWLNRAWTPEGRRRVAASLTKEQTDSKGVSIRQAAVRELQALSPFRIGLEAFAHRVQQVAAHFEERNPGVSAPPHVKIPPRFLSYLLPALLLGSAAAAYLHYLSWGPVAAIFAVNLLLYLVGVKKRLHDGAAVRHYAETLGVYTDAVAHIEGQAFSCGALSDLRARLHPGTEEPASLALDELRRLGGWLEVQQIPLFHFLLNTIFLYDFHWFARWNFWREEHAHSTAHWVEAVGDFESLVTAAGVAFDHPGWCYPQVAEGEPHVDGQAMGHPLIPKNERVANNVSLRGRGMLLVLTGSNMSGKSTYMRTIGVNLVLANIGSPVCATHFEATPLIIFTAMRSGDNLAQGISAFYAELLRIRNLVEASRHGPVLFLIDEIFHGTNSKDRHEGAKIVIENLRSNGATGVVTTHDLELAETLKDEENTRLAHFSETYQNNELQFNYVLQEGISQSRNAIALMRLVGIEPRP